MMRRPRGPLDDLRISDERSFEELEGMPRTVRHVLAKPMTARRAARLIAEFTFVATVLGGTLAWALDRDDFPTLGTGLWWSLQTVTTVGYGDVTPKHTEGRVIATFVMLAGLAFLAVLTASVTATFVEAARKRLMVEEEDEVAPHLRRIGDELQSLNARMDGLEAAVAVKDESHGDG
jgi:voltage-gated potassium channel